MVFLRKWLILTHRYLGIALSLLFVMWFASGIVMMYAGGMPRLTPETRLERLAPLDLARVALTPSDAAARAGVEPEGRTTLQTVLGRPAYRFGGRDTATVFADTGALLDTVTVEQARAAATQFVADAAAPLTYAGEVSEPDQWTMTLARALPMHRFDVADGRGSRVYVSAATGEVALATTRRDRLLAWVGVIPHWLYFAPLRLNQPLWYEVMVWLPALGCVMAALGLGVGIVQFRRTKPFRLSASIPYAGWTRWHYVTGAIFGLFSLTWVYSGLLSMEPFAWTNATGLEVDRDVFSGGPVDLGRFSSFDPAGWAALADGRAIKEVEFQRIQDEPYYVVRRGAHVDATRGERLHQPYYVTGRAEADRLLVAAGTLRVRTEPFSPDSLVARLRAALPGETIAETALLSSYDDYYYSRRQQTPLPVLRVKFADPAETWFYVDPEMSQLLASVHRLNRVERWLYNGLHSLDFAFWYNSPAWDVGVIVLSLGGLSTSAMGLYLGLKRLRRGLRSAVRAPLGAPQTDPASQVTSG